MQVESLYPNELGPSSMSTEEFLNRGLQSLDSYMADKVRGASLKGNVLRYVCVIEGSRYLVIDLSIHLHIPETPNFTSVSFLSYFMYWMFPLVFCYGSLCASFPCSWTKKKEKKGMVVGVNFNMNDMQIYFVKLNLN